MHELAAHLDNMPLIWLGFAASFIAGLGAGVGALPIFFIRKLSDKTQDILLSFSAGIMLAATFFSLLLPGIEVSETLFANKLHAVLVVIAGVLSGAVALWLAHRYSPHEHFLMGREGPERSRLSRIWLFVIAITLHNFPEGMAVGVGFAGGDLANGMSIAVGIGVQNIPEGLAVAAALVTVGYTRLGAFLVALLTGLVEPVGGLVGASAAWLTQSLLAGSLGFAAGSMLFVISDEIIPETHRHGYEDHATFSLMVGFVVMMFLDVSLGG